MDGEAIAIGYFGTVTRGLRVVGGGLRFYTRVTILRSV